MQWTNVTYYFRNDITWHDGVPFTVDDLNFSIYTYALYGDSWTHSSYIHCVNAPTPNNYNPINDYKPYFQKWDDWTCSVQVDTSSWLNVYMPNYEMIPEHLYKYIVPSSLADAKAGISTDGLHGIWPGQAATVGNFLPGGVGVGITYANVHSLPDYTLVGTGPWKYRPGSTDATLLVSVGGGCTLDAYSGFWMKIAPGAIALRYTWVNSDPDDQPSGGYYKVGLLDLSMLANSYGKTGTPPSTVPISGNPGSLGAWNPGADIAAPAGVVGLSDLVTLALHYGWYWGNYSYNPTLPASEVGSGYP
jgi:hypothetical protein